MKMAQLFPLKVYQVIMKFICSTKHCLHNPFSTIRIVVILYTSPMTWVNVSYFYETECIFHKLLLLTCICIYVMSGLSDIFCATFFPFV